MDLSLVIVTYNSRAFIGACLDSLRPCLADRQAEVCVVDNRSSDGTAAFVREHHPWVTVVESQTNGGFAHGINVGLARTTGNYVLWLNPDSRIRPDSAAGLDEWIGWMDENPEVGVCGGKVLNPGGTLQRSVRSFPSYGAVFGARYSIFTKLWPENPFSSKYLRSDLLYDTPAPVDWVSGACLLHRRSVSDAIDGPDEGFFMYFEDVDFCYRAWKSGWKVYFHPAFAVEHHIGGSSEQVPVRMLAARHRSMWRWYTKHFQRFWLKDVFIWAGIWTRCAWLIVARLWRR